MIKYAHVGLPKCGSTWLQTRFFPNHPELFHLGKFATPLGLPFVLRRLFFSDLIETSRYEFDATDYRKLFRDYHAQAEAEQGKRAIGISLESINLLSIGRVDLDERAQRLLDIMGSDTRVIFLIREQCSWLTSLYCTLVKEGGLTLSFEDWCFYTCYERDYGLYANLLYDRIYQSYANRVGIENVLVLFFEEFSKDTTGSIAQFCDFVGVSRFGQVDASPVHQKADPETLGAMLALNRKWKFALGRDRFKRLGPHRLQEWYTEVCKIPLPDHFESDKQRHRIMYTAPENVRRIAQEECGSYESVDLTMPDSVKTDLHRLLAPHNRNLIQLSGLDLGRYGYAL